jgi:hydroxypyruvate isomerase
VLEPSACIEWLFAEEPAFVRRVADAGAAGLESVEFWTWRDKNLEQLRSALEETGVQLTSFVSQPEGRLVDPATHDDFLQGVAESAEVAASFGCRGLIVLAGDALDGTPRSSQRDALADALRRAAPIAAEHDVTLLLEPLNTRVDHAGYFLDATPEALDVVQDVGAPNVRLLYDLYHSFVMGEVPAAVVGDRADLIGHVHVADVPGRHEPGTGTVDWGQAIAWLRASGYDGRIGLEYMPSRSTVESLSYLQGILRRA